MKSVFVLIDKINTDHGSDESIKIYEDRNDAVKTAELLVKEAFIVNGNEDLYLESDGRRKSIWKIYSKKADRYVKIEDEFVRINDPYCEIKIVRRPVSPKTEES